ncbi:magnesium/cobalt transporter CorA [uncultured Lutibacter sp.]|uniref:magnesium/cobalt transporter CorA n=1 Tax=uncultured Lutibacter sp. TaxID=437739 RepID=UPI002602A82A|nr:magnesium/cobalt transporter CorA [uncultured Lutibacter sp.]
MARFLKTKKEEVGLSPEAFKLRGEKKSDAVLLRIIDFDPQKLEEYIVEEINNIENCNKTNSVTWFNIDGIHDEKIMTEISSTFELEPMILSDVMNPHARPKIHEYDNCIYLSLKMLQYDEVMNYISSENLVIIIKENVLISFQERKGDVFEPVRERIRKNKKTIRTSRVDYLAFSLIDVVLDNYKYIISEIGAKIESLEVDLLQNPEVSVLEQINSYKKEIIYLSKSIKPSKEIISELLKMESEYLSDSIYIHLQELQNNIHQSIESIESYREILSDQLHIYHTTISSKLNDTMKFLTVFSVVFIPLTFIAGIYGTNFDFIPELHYKYSYFIMLGIMLLIAILMISYFKKKKWF